MASAGRDTPIAYTNSRTKAYEASRAPRHPQHQSTRAPRHPEMQAPKHRRTQAPGTVAPKHPGAQSTREAKHIGTQAPKQPSTQAPMCPSTKALRQPSAHGCEQAPKYPGPKYTENCSLGGPRLVAPLRPSTSIGLLQHSLLGTGVKHRLALLRFCLCVLLLSWLAGARGHAYPGLAFGVVFYSFVAGGAAT